jgi:hypothetical protein
VFKHHVLHNRETDRFPPGFQEALPEERRVQSLWWEGSFDFDERIMVSADELDPYLADFVERHRHDVSLPPASPGSPLRRLARRARRTIGT